MQKKPLLLPVVFWATASREEEEEVAYVYLVVLCEKQLYLDINLFHFEFICKPRINPLVNAIGIPNPKLHFQSPNCLSRFFNNFDCFSDCSNVSSSCIFKFRDNKSAVSDCFCKSSICICCVRELFCKSVISCSSCVKFPCTDDSVDNGSGQQNEHTDNNINKNAISGFFIHSYLYHY